MCEDCEKMTYGGIRRVVSVPPRRWNEKGGEEKSRKHGEERKIWSMDSGIDVEEGDKFMMDAHCRLHQHMETYNFNNCLNPFTIFNHEKW
jgi:hypothetical protein